MRPKNQELEGSECLRQTFHRNGLRARRIQEPQANRMANSQWIFVEIPVDPDPDSAFEFNVQVYDRTWSTVGAFPLCQMGLVGPLDLFPRAVLRRGTGASHELRVDVDRW